jgi:predicted nucleic acid-binding protein
MSWSFNPIEAPRIRRHPEASRPLKRFRADDFDLFLSEHLPAEFAEVMADDRARRRHQRSDAEISSIVGDLARFARLVEPTERLMIIVDDPNDDKILAAAVAGETEIFASGDRHPLALKLYLGRRIVSPAVFVTVLKQADG